MDNTKERDANANLDDITQAFKRFMKTIIQLRGPDGCPWDREQTVYSLRKFLIEESFETVTAINHGIPDDIKEELGDVLLVALMLGHIAEDENICNLRDLFAETTEKLIRRHPHVFKTIQNRQLGDAEHTPESVRKQWQAIKETQEGKTTITEPTSYPPLERAAKIQKNAVRKGFDWQNSGQLLDKVREELDELQGEMSKKHLSEKDNTREKLEEEFGDLLFSVTSIGRVLNIDPSLALHRTNEKFLKRFQYLEEHMDAQDMNSDNLEEMTRVWNAAKAFDKTSESK